MPFEKYIRKLHIWFHHWMAVAFEGHADDVAIEYVRALVALDDQWGLLDLGVRMQDGRSVDVNHEEALSLYRRASATEGSLTSLAESNIGSCYLKGLGVPKDSVEASRWYKSAAEKGHPTSQYNYGLSLVDGWGVEENKHEGRKWLERAAATGMQEAKDSLELMDQRGE